TGISFYLDGASSAGGNSINSSNGVMTFVAAWTGSSVITAVAEGCNGPAISSLTVTTFPVPTASITYLGSPFCKSIETKQPVTLTGTPGGVFSATPTGLVIDPATGEITPSASKAGRYAITYAISSNYGCCEITATASVTISICNVKPITVTASHGQSKIFGDPDPVLSCYYTPALLAGDVFTGYLSREPGESIGTYPITLGNLSAGPNYQITFISANFEIIASSADATLADLRVDGTTITGFSPSVYTYDLIFLPGTGIIPVITATTKNLKATKIITPAATIPGSTKILVTSEDGSRQISYEVKMTLQTTGINQISDQSNFIVYPNPNNGTFTIEYQPNGTGTVRLSVLGITGKVLIDKMYRTGSKITEVIQMPDRSGGIYLIRLINDSGVSYRKIVVE
ncbi:MAG: MBG domain-containing protein, partial [Bacteroidia bacterium]|nr:MBG domain-containing protein [Bacteroidia bacterium]